jgi:tetratricopeptide (TPR) repeat protein
VHDVPYLHTHPLARSGASASPGGTLQRALLGAIDALRPAPTTPSQSAVRRRHELLALRYVEGLPIAQVHRRLGISRALYFRELERALGALLVVFRERWPTEEPRRTGERRVSAADVGEPASRLALVEGPLVGRTDLFAAVVDLYRTARQGQPRAAVLLGEAGIGKTRLATELLGWTVAQGADVLRARAFEAGGRLPYQPLVDALRPRLEREPEPRQLLGEVWLTELSRLLPELRERDPVLPVATGDEAAARARLLEAIARLGRAIAERAPLVLFLDDLQWADAASLDGLRYAARRWAESGTPALLLLAVRSEALAADSALAEWLTGLGRDLPSVQLELGALDAEDTRGLVHALRVDSGARRDEFGRWLFEETGGHPFFVMESLKSLLERGVLVPRLQDGAWVIDVVGSPADGGMPRGFVPPGVRELVHARLGRLGPTAGALLAAAAVLGQGFTFEQLVRIAGTGEDEALPAMDEALRAHLVREAAGAGERGAAASYVFTHDKIRDVAYEEAGDARRRVFHRRALGVLRAAGAAPAVLTPHALAAGLDEEALGFGLAAGDDAMRLLAPRDAIASYGEAIAAALRLGRGDVLADLHARRGRAFVAATLWADARRDLEAALQGLGAGPRSVEVLTDLAEACFWLLDVPSARRYGAEAAALGEALGRGDQAAEATAWLAATEGADGNPPAGVELADRSIARALALGLAPPAQARTQKSLQCYWLGRFDEALAASREAVEEARAANDMPVMLEALPHLGLALAGAGRYDEAARAFAQARRLGHEHGLANLRARAIAMSAGFRLDLFDFTGAEARAREAREAARAAQFLPPAVSAGIDLLLNFARRGDVGRADELIGEVAAQAEQIAGFHGWLWRLRLAQARAEIALARGAWEEALGWAADAVEQSRARARVKYHVLGLAARGQALGASGRANEAVTDLRDAVALARSVGDPALFVRVADRLLAVDGDEALLASARAAVERIRGALPDAETRGCFESAQPVRRLARRS